MGIATSRARLPRPSSRGLRSLPWISFFEAARVGYSADVSATLTIIRTRCKRWAKARCATATPRVDPAVAAGLGARRRAPHAPFTGRLGQGRYAVGGPWRAIASRLHPVRTFTINPTGGDGYSFAGASRRQIIRQYDGRDLLVELVFGILDRSHTWAASPSKARMFPGDWSSTRVDMLPTAPPARYRGGGR